MDYSKENRRFKKIGFEIDYRKSEGLIFLANRGKPMQLLKYQVVL